MPTLKDKQFDMFAMKIADAVSWNQGVGYEWEGSALMSAEFLGDLVRLAFEAPKRSRDEFMENI